MAKSPERLERLYRQLLAWYPTEHRRTYGEEMIGVLLASAADGQEHSRLAESAGLIRGDLRIRLLLVSRRLLRSWLQRSPSDVAARARSSSPRPSANSSAEPLLSL